MAGTTRFSLARICVPLLFFLSGSCALVYQTAWVRAFTLEFGSTTLAISIVIAVFMAGLALGAALAGPRVDKAQRPLWIYGVLEVALALYALATPAVFGFCLPRFAGAAAHFADNTLGLSLIRCVATFCLLLPPTILMGATLPILARFYTLRRSDGGWWAGMLYGINTLGAFLGALAGGIWMLPNFGLERTLHLTASINLIAGLLAMLLATQDQKRQAVLAESGTSAEPHAQEGAEVEPQRHDVREQAAAAGAHAGERPMLMAVMLTGFAAMACEVIWSRVLSLIIGGSIYSFTIVLCTFLVGLGLGAALVAAGLKRFPRRAGSVFFVLALLAAISVAMGSAAFPYLPPTFVRLYHAWEMEQNPDRVLMAQFLLASAVMFIPTLIMGGLFPAAARVVVSDPRTTGTDTGRLYAWNTIGSIVGSFAAAFILVPLLGIRGALLLAAGMQCAGALISRLSQPGRWIPAAAGAVAVPALLLWLTPSWDRHIMTSGMFEYAHAYEQQDDPQSLREKLSREEKLLFYEDGLTATITVAQSLDRPNGDIYISTNGKIDGSNYADMPTQRLSAHLPLLLHPDPKLMCVIGMGTGCTAGSAALHPLKQVTLVEIEKQMIEGSRFFKDVNHNVHENPRVDIRETDGRLFLRLHPRSFDVITSEPSNPWLAGTSDLFTVEFYELGARALRPGGVFCQWVQLYSMSPENVKVMLRTFTRVFPYVYLASSILRTDILLIGTLEPLPIDIEQMAQRMHTEPVLSDLTDPRVGVMSVYDLLARVRMGPRAVRRLAGNGAVHTDDLPIIAYRAPRDHYRNTRTANSQMLAYHAQGIAQLLVDERGDEGGTLDRNHYLELYRAYRRFLPRGDEAVTTRKLLEQIDQREAGR